MACNPERKRRKGPLQEEGHQIVEHGLVTCLEVVRLTRSGATILTARAGRIMLSRKANWPVPMSRNAIPDRKNESPAPGEVQGFQDGPCWGRGRSGPPRLMGVSTWVKDTCIASPIQVTDCNNVCLLVWEVSGSRLSEEAGACQICPSSQRLAERATVHCWQMFAEHRPREARGFPEERLLHDSPAQADSCRP